MKKCSELIIELQNFIAKNGDLPVAVIDDGNVIEYTKLVEDSIDENVSCCVVY